MSRTNNQQKMRELKTKFVERKKELGDTESTTMGYDPVIGGDPVLGNILNQFSTLPLRHGNKRKAVAKIKAHQRKKKLRELEKIDIKDQE